jgi:hypothetical protein
LVRLNSLRLHTFATSTKCVKCGLEGTVFLKQRARKQVSDSFHLNLYGINAGKYVLFTKDHIQAKSEGGGDVIENMQTMCQPCNELKASRDNAEFMAS